MMKNIVIKLRLLATREDAQDMVEYAMVVALICFGATAGMSSLASGVNHAFGNVSTTLAANITSILF